MRRLGRRGESSILSILTNFAECVGTQFVSVVFSESNYSKGAIVLGGNITQREVCKRYRFESDILHLNLRMVHESASISPDMSDIGSVYGCHTPRFRLIPGPLAWCVKPMLPDLALDSLGIKQPYT